MNKKKKVKRYKNTLFLQTLGQHCKSLRLQKGYSIDRLYLESDQLSTSVIHRLENGLADTQISVFYRYAQTLGLRLSDLFDLDLAKSVIDEKNLADKNIESTHTVVQIKKGKSTVPFYSLKIAVGAFSNGRITSEKPEGWVKIPNSKKLNTNHYFVAQISGHSMEPLIPDKSFCLFRFYSGGSRQNKIFLFKAHGWVDPETKESFVIKKYLRLDAVDENQDRDHVKINLISLNKSFKPIVLSATDDRTVETVAEFVRVLP